MGFHEDDRIRHKNRAYNFPNPDINEAARRYTSSIGLSGAALVEELKSRLDANDDSYTREVLVTAIAIAKME